MKGLKIKVCGITNRKDARRLVDLDVDALGFIVTEKRIPSKINLDLASKIIKKMPANVLSVVGVGIYPVNEIVDICRKSNAGCVQLQYGGSLSDIKKIRRSLPYLKIWKTIFTHHQEKSGSGQADKK